jgi:formylglycine-generating enzyme required for sulfatase activity
MDVTETTKSQWDNVYIWAIANGYTFDNAGKGKAENHPVHTVNWYDCMKWCNARSEREGLTPCYTVEEVVYRQGQSTPDCDFETTGYRLATRIEWEYAARGGLVGQRFPWGNTITHSQANYSSSTNNVYDISPTRGYHPDYITGLDYPYSAPAGSFSPNGYGLYDMAGNSIEYGVNGVHDGAYNSGADRLRVRSLYGVHPSSAYGGLGLRTVRR